MSLKIEKEYEREGKKPKERERGREVGRGKKREQSNTCKNLRLSLGSWTDWCGSFMVVSADEE